MIDFGPRAVVPVPGPVEVLPGRFQVAMLVMLIVEFAQVQASSSVSRRSLARLSLPGAPPRTGGGSGNLSRNSHSLGGRPSRGSWVNQRGPSAKAWTWGWSHRPC